MHRIYGILIAGLLALPAGAGEWSTTYGTMTFPDQPVAGPVFSRYQADEGRIIGQMELGAAGPLVMGTWVEASSGVTCDTPVDGSLHWGEVEFWFDPAYTRFTGAWYYCGQATPHDWSGTLMR